MIDDLVKFLSMFALPILLLGIIVSLIIATIFGDYNMLHNTISELGVTKCTPLPQIFNYSFMISSFFFIFFYLYCGKIALESFPNKHAVIIATSLLLISAVGMFFIGFFDIEKNDTVHHISALITFTTLGIGELIMAIMTSKNIGNPIQMIILVVVFCGVAGLFIIFPSPLLEWLFFAVLICWGFPMIIRMY